eukprot:4291453-Pleurochrysis_carterae.AAC.1
MDCVWKAEKEGLEYHTASELEEVTGREATAEVTVTEKRTEGPPRDGHNDGTEGQGWSHRTCDKHGQRNMRSNPQMFA